MLYSLQIFLYCWKGKASFSNGSSGGLGLISFSFRVGVFIICKEIPYLRSYVNRKDLLPWSSPWAAWG